ncbi:MAG: O-antigen ligase family protein [Firmicutes bacterium]|nr:O-antigen ligase family protein [Bacillota bacterium]
MTDMIKASLIYRFFAVIGRWLSAQWMDSRIIRAFVNMKSEEDVAEGSRFFQLGSRLRDLQAGLFKILKFDRLFSGSIFAMPYIWCLAAVVLAPLIPTMALLGFVLLGAAASVICFGTDRERQLVRAPVNRYIILYAALYMAATLMSVTVSGSLYIGLLSSVFILSAVAIENSVRTEKQMLLMVKLMVLAAVLVSLYGIYQHFFGTGGTETWVDEDMFSSISTRVYSTLDNPNVLSEYLLLAIPLTASCLFASENWSGRLLYLAACGIMCLCMIYTFSRGGWLGLLFSIFIFLILVDRRFIFVILLGAVCLLLFSPDVITERFSSIGNVTDTSTSYRVSIWMGTLAMLRDYWMTGIGPGTQAFNMIYPAYSYNTISAPHAHNLFLQIICDAGIAGILLFAILIVVFIRMNCHAISVEKDRRYRLFQIGSLASVGGFMVQSMTDYSFYNYRVMFLFWAYIALSAVFCRAGTLEKEDC